MAISDGYEIKVALSKDLLRRIMTTPCDSRGELPFSREEQSWAMGLCRRYVAGEESPTWAIQIFKELGIKPN